MAEQTFRSPGFFEQEIDLSSRQTSVTGTPAGVIGTADRGPAFVPVTIGSFTDFETKFGSLDADRFGPYAVKEFLDNRDALTYLRLLGAGANDTTGDITTTQTQGTVKNAGFRIIPTNVGRSDGTTASEGAVQVIAASHIVPIDEAVGYPIFTDNESFDLGGRDAAVDTVRLVRGVVLTATGTKIELIAPDAFYTPAGGASDVVTAGAVAGSPLTAAKYFKLVVSSSTGGATFGTGDGFSGLRILTASLDPNDSSYLGKVLNTDPLKFQTEGHLLYQDLAVEEEIASTLSSNVAVLSGSSLTSDVSGDTSQSFLNAYGRFDTRYTTPKTTKFISQPFGGTEFDLFHFETLDDGAVANDKFKVSISNIRASNDPTDKYGTFEVQVRLFGDEDTNKEIVERFPECSLDPNSDRFIGKQIGDKKVYYDFDQADPDERRLVVKGKYPNVSQRIRVRLAKEVESKDIPAECLPFGFHGIPALKTTDTLTDNPTRALVSANGRTVGSHVARRLNGKGLDTGARMDLSGSVIPPLPMRFKVTKGSVNGATSPPFVGSPGNNERANASYYWGVKTTKLMPTGTLSNAVRQSNAADGANPLVSAYTQFSGIEKLDLLATGSGKDSFNSNKFTLARVALSNATTTNNLDDVFTEVTGTAKDHMVEAAYIRNGNPDPTTYTVSDGLRSNRFTLASLVATSSVLFNRFTDYAKFTNIFYGGFDGVNILDKDQAFFTDRSLSSGNGGRAQDVPGNADRIGLGLVDGKNQAGGDRLNNNVASMRRAVDIMTDPMASNINILAIPGARDSYVTDHALTKVKDFSQAIYVMDLVKYDQDGNRLYDDSSGRVDVRETAEGLESRALDNNYGATFFPDVFINDEINNQVVKVPASVAALGTFGFNDKVAFPWFAPAGFNRGGLDFVTNVETRLTSDERDTLYDARINPIAVFPNAGFVIFGQKSLQMQKSALDRINVRRLMLEVKRQVVRVADKLLFEPNNSQTRARFVSQITPLLSLIQAQAGLEQFKVVCDETNNSSEDVEANKMNGRIIVVPTRVVEFISVDFIITNSGVSFE